MTIAYSAAVANARLDAVETAIGVSAVLKIRTLAPPALITDVDVGTVLATLTLPVDWMSNAAARSKALLGTWSDPSAAAAGTAAHFRIYATGGTTQHFQGTITATAGGGDMTLDNTSIAVGQVVTVTGFTLSE